MGACQSAEAPNSATGKQYVEDPPVPRAEPSDTGGETKVKSAGIRRLWMDDTRDALGDLAADNKELLAYICHRGQVPRQDYDPKRLIVSTMATIGTVLCSRRTDKPLLFFDQSSIPLDATGGEVMSRALSQSKVLIVIVSKELPESDWCNGEIEAFKRRGGPVVSLYWDQTVRGLKDSVEDCEPEIKEMYRWLSAKQGKTFLSEDADVGVRAKAFVVGAFSHFLQDFASDKGTNFVKPRFQHLSNAELLELSKRVYDRVLEVNQGDSNYTSDMLLRVTREFEGKVAMVGNFPVLVPDFQERTNIHQAMENAFQSGQERVLLLGAGGMGKSQLAVDWCQRTLQNYSVLLWLGGESRTRLLESLVSVAHELKLDFNEQDEKGALGAVNGFLRQHPGSLTVVDNVDADAYQHIKDLLPVGRLIVTSRDRSFPRRFHVVAVDRFSVQKSVNYLGSDEKSQDLAEELDCMPLALSMAKAIKHETRQNSSQVLQRLKRRPSLLFKKEDVDQDDIQRRTVASTFNISIEAVRKETNSEFPLELLKVCAYLNPDSIPITVLLQYVPMDGSSQDVDAALDVLVRFHLISRNETGDLTMHRILQGTLRWMVSQEDPSSSLLRHLVNWMAQKFSAVFNYDSPPTWKKASVWQDPAASVAMHAANLKGGREPALAADALRDSGRLKERQGQYPLSMELHGSELKLRKQLFGPEDPSVADTLNNMGLVCEFQAKYAEAIEKYEESLRIKEATWGRENVSVAITLNNMAVVYEKQQLFPKALVQHTEALRIRRKLFGDNHPAVAETLNNMAVVLEKQGDLDESLKNHQESLRIKLATLGENHPAVADTLNNMAVVYQQQGEFQKSILNHKKALRIKQELFGRVHPSVAETLSNLGAVYVLQEDLDAAVELFVEAREMNERLTGPSHPAAVSNLKWLAEIHRRQGNYAQALAEFQDILQADKATFGPQSLSVAETLTSIGVVHRDLGQTEDARQVWTKALAVFTATVGAAHPQATAVAGALEQL